jgi:hypothetical protein
MLILCRSLRLGEDAAVDAALADALWANGRVTLAVFRHPVYRHDEENDEATGYGLPEALLSMRWCRTVLASCRSRAAFSGRQRP